MRRFWFSVGYLVGCGLTCLAFLTAPGTAHADRIGDVSLKGPGFSPIPADANSYLSYLQDHQVYTAFNSASKNLQAGFYACQALHAGQTPEQVAASSPPMFISVDVRGMIDAAQRELCPDTLGR